MEVKENTVCLQCEKELLGRKDKKFCDYHCRNEFHNHLRKVGETYMNKINLILKYNRLILNRFCPEGKVLVNESELLRFGFSMDHFTGYYKSRSGGNIYKMCYEYGYRPNPKFSGQYILVKFNFSNPMA